MKLAVKRIYEPPANADGQRVLVDRIWPRGVSKSEARVHRWARELAPSTALRKWFGHDSARWDEFVARYARELESEPEALEELREMANARKVTLLFGARETRFNNAVALRKILQGSG